MHTIHGENVQATPTGLGKTRLATEGDTMKKYKGHPIYGIAVPAPGHRWCSCGLVFDTDLTQTIEIKRIQSATGLVFKGKQEAEEHGLKLCRDWIDEQTPAAS
jgi:hypothetical protein